MSHITKRKTAIKDVETLKKAIARTPGAEYQGLGRGRSYSGTQEGHIVKLPGWNYPVTFNPVTGEASYDNYGGRWGKEEELDKLNQNYAVEAAKAQAEVDGHTCEEMQLADGSIKLTIPLGGGGYEVEGGAGGSSGGWGF